MIQGNGSAENLKGSEIARLLPLNEISLMYQYGLFAPLSIEVLCNASWGIGASGPDLYARQKSPGRGFEIFSAWGIELTAGVILNQETTPHVDAIQKP